MCKHENRPFGIGSCYRAKNYAVTTTSKLSELQLPAELPSIEEQLKVLAAAIETRIGQVEQLGVMRLRTIIQGVRVYQDLLAKFVDYRGVEAKVADLEEKYAKLLEDQLQPVFRRCFVCPL